jgi:hypothetical protein
LELSLFEWTERLGPCLYNFTANLFYEEWQAKRDVDAKSYSRSRKPMPNMEREAKKEAEGASKTTR